MLFNRRIRKRENERAIEREKEREREIKRERNIDLVRKGENEKKRCYMIDE